MDSEATNKDSLENKPSKRKRRKRPRKVSAEAPDYPLYPLLCFDSETTNHGEILELSVFDIEGNEVFHRYFRPRAKSWPTEIHHITPEMVAQCKRFAAHKHEIQKLLNSSANLLGCAVSNDIHTLKRYGITLNRKNQNVFDIQNWHWLLNDTSDRLEKHQSGLSAIAAHYGLDFGDEMAHSATADTRLTLQCFKKLLGDFRKRRGGFHKLPDLKKIKEGAGCDAWEAALKEYRDSYNSEYGKAMQMHRMRNTVGFINVLKREQGYSLKYTRFEQPGKENLVFCVPVNDRVKAEYELRDHFMPRQVKGFTGIYNFREEDFDFIRNYTNSIDIDAFIEREERLIKEKQSLQERALKLIDRKQPPAPAKRKSKGIRKLSPKRAATRAMRIIKNLGSKSD